jgi:nucleoporin NUP159
MVCSDYSVEHRTWYVHSTKALPLLDLLHQALVSSPLADLRSHLSSLDGKSDNTFQPQRIIPISTATPNHLIFAYNDTRLVVGLTHGPVIVFEASSICSPGSNEVAPLHTFLPTTPTPSAVRQMYANPGDFPQLVAILREPDGSPDSQLVEVINVSTMQSVAGWSSGGTPETFPTSSACPSCLTKFLAT